LNEFTARILSRLAQHARIISVLVDNEHLRTSLKQVFFLNFTSGSFENGRIQLPNLICGVFALLNLPDQILRKRIQTPKDFLNQQTTLLLTVIFNLFHLLQSDFESAPMIDWETAKELFEV